MVTVEMQNQEVGVELKFSVSEAGIAYDLTGATIKLRVQSQPERDVEIVGAPEAGLCRYVTEESDFEPGTYKAQLAIVPVAGRLYLTELFDLVIAEAVAVA